MLGLCCHWLNKSGKNLLPSKQLRLGKFNEGAYSHDRIKNTYITNLKCLKQTLPQILKSGIHVFRMSSSMFPLFDKVPRQLWNDGQVIDLLGSIGQFVLSNNIRLTTHPGQFTVLSSPNVVTVANATREMNFHGWIFDQMGLPRTPYYAINIHGGGKPERLSTLVQSIRALHPSARLRMTLENCEFGWSVKDLMRVHEATKVPIVFDSHHHKFNRGGMSAEDAMAFAIASWPLGIKPLTHLSNSPENVASSAPVTKLRAHSDFIYEIPDYQADFNNSDLIDIDIEAKKKNLAIFDMVTRMGIKL